MFSKAISRARFGYDVSEIGLGSGQSPCKVVNPRSIQAPSTSQTSKNSTIQRFGLGKGKNSHAVGRRVSQEKGGAHEDVRKVGRIPVLHVAFSATKISQTFHTASQPPRSSPVGGTIAAKNRPAACYCAGWDTSPFSLASRKVGAYA